MKGFEPTLWDHCISREPGTTAEFTTLWDGQSCPSGSRATNKIVHPAAQNFIRNHIDRLLFFWSGNLLPAADSATMLGQRPIVRSVVILSRTHFKSPLPGPSPGEGP